MAWIEKRGMQYRVYSRMAPGRGAPKTFATAMGHRAMTCTNSDRVDVTATGYGAFA